MKIPLTAIFSRLLCSTTINLQNTQKSGLVTYNSLFATIQSTNKNKICEKTAAITNYEIAYIEDAINTLQNSEFVHDRCQSMQRCYFNYLNYAILHFRY